MTYFNDGYKGEQEIGNSRQHKASSAVLSIIFGQFWRENWEEMTGSKLHYKNC